MDQRYDQMKTYIDGFVFPVARVQLPEYKVSAEKIAALWMEYGRFQSLVNISGKP